MQRNWISRREAIRTTVAALGALSAARAVGAWSGGDRSPLAPSRDEQNGVVRYFDEQGRLVQEIRPVRPVVQAFVYHDVAPRGTGGF